MPRARVESARAIPAAKQTTNHAMGKALRTKVNLQILFFVASQLQDSTIEAPGLCGTGRIRTELNE